MSGNALERGSVYPQKDVFSGVGEIASYLRVSESVCHRWLKKGLLPINKLGKSYAATREQLQEIVRKGVVEFDEPTPISVYDRYGNLIGTVSEVLPPEN